VTERKVIVGPDIARRLGALLTDAEGVASVLGRLRENLQLHPAGYRANRDEAEPDFLFNVPVPLTIHGRIRYVHFSVNDTTSPDHFIVEAVSLSD
jgi:hypothetical protein